MKLSYKIFSCFSDWHEAYLKDEPFKAVEIGGILRPIKYKTNTVFIHGIGGKKFNKKDIVVVPQITEGINIQDYLDLYGKDCLFYTLTGRLINSNDCCYWEINAEFDCMLYFGVDKWIDYIDRVNKLIDVTKNIYIEKWGVNPYIDKVQTAKNKQCIFRQNIFKIKIKHFLRGILRVKPYFDVIQDDLGLENTYKYLILDEPLADIENDKNFPISMKDRLEYLFNEYVSNEYKSLMWYF
jgi:hypothetical protein